MSQIHIAVIVGSLRKDSFNRQLAQAVIKMVPCRGAVHASAYR